MDPYLGRYFSAEYVRKNILGQSDTEMKEIDDQIKDEIKKGIIPDPSMMMNPMDPSMGMDMQNQNTLGNPPQEPTSPDSGMSAGNENIGQI